MVENILGDLSFLKNSLQSMGWEIGFESSVVGSVLILLASACVVTKNGFKAIHGIIWFLYWSLVVSFRTWKWMFTKKPIPLPPRTDVEKAVLLSFEEAVYVPASSCIVGKNASAQWGSGSIFHIYVNQKEITPRIGEEVSKIIRNKYLQLREAHRIEEEKKLDCSIVEALSGKVKIEYNTNTIPNTMNSCDYKIIC